MSWSLFSGAGTPITLEPAMPPHYRGLLLPGARTHFADTGQVFIVRQELPLVQCLLRLSYFAFSGGKPALAGRLLSPHLQSRIQLRGAFSTRLQGLGKLSLKESQHALVGLPPTECSATFERGAPSQSLDIIYPEDLLRELTPHFPRLEKILAAYAAGKPAPVTPPHSWSTSAMLHLVQDLLACPFDAGLREVYLENKVRELLLLQLHGAFGRPPGKEGPFSQREVAAVYAVRRLILADIGRHQTISELARAVGLNDFTLKAVFKQVFGMGPFECLLQARMDRARDLLLTTEEPIKAIAAHTGYRYLTSFITAFRKHFGYTPASLRREGD